MSPGVIKNVKCVPGILIIYCVVCADIWCGGSGGQCLSRLASLGRRSGNSLKPRLGGAAVSTGVRTAGAVIGARFSLGRVPAPTNTSHSQHNTNTVPASRGNIMKKNDVMPAARPPDPKEGGGEAAAKRDDIDENFVIRSIVAQIAREPSPEEAGEQPPPLRRSKRIYTAGLHQAVDEPCTLTIPARFSLPMLRAITDITQAEQADRAYDYMVELIKKGGQQQWDAPVYGILMEKIYEGLLHYKVVARILWVLPIPADQHWELRYVRKFWADQQLAPYSHPVPGKIPRTTALDGGEIVVRMVDKEGKLWPQPGRNILFPSAAFLNNYWESKQEDLNNHYQRVVDKNSRKIQQLKNKIYDLNGIVRSLKSDNRNSGSPGSTSNDEQEESSSDSELDDETVAARLSILDVGSNTAQKKTENEYVSMTAVKPGSVLTEEVVNRMERQRDERAKLRTFVKPKVFWDLDQQFEHNYYTAFVKDKYISKLNRSTVDPGCRWCDAPSYGQWYDRKFAQCDLGIPGSTPPVCHWARRPPRHEVLDFVMKAREDGKLPQDQLKDVKNVIRQYEEEKMDVLGNITLETGQIALSVLCSGYYIEGLKQTREIVTHQAPCTYIM